MDPTRWPYAPYFPTLAPHEPADRRDDDQGASG